MYHKLVEASFLASLILTTDDVVVLKMELLIQLASEYLCFGPCPNVTRHSIMLSSHQQIGNQSEQFTSSSIFFTPRCPENCKSQRVSTVHHWSTLRTAIRSWKVRWSLLIWYLDLSENCSLPCCAIEITRSYPDGSTVDCWKRLEA